MEKVNKYLIVAAGGNGSRTKSIIPKQYLEISGRPLIVWTMEAFKAFVEIKNIIVVISKSHIEYWNEIVKYYPEYSNCKIAYAGPTRFHSIKSGLKYIPMNAYVAVHDAARPMVSSITIENCFKTAISRGNSIPVIKVNDSVRQKVGSISKAINRDELSLVQTPQIYKSEMIIKAYEQTFNESFTDDASVVENNGEVIYFSEGNHENFKITTSLDLKMANLILSSSYPSTQKE